jgi:subtilisin family serine protease
MLNKNIWRKVILLSVLGSIVVHSIPSMMSNPFQNSHAALNQIKLQELDKLQLSKKLSYFGGEVKASAESEINDNIVPGELMVKFKDLSTKESFVKENVGDGVVNPSLVTKFSTPTTGDDTQDKTNTLNLVNQLKNDTRISWAEPNMIAHRSFVPNDTKYFDQWALKNTGQNTLAFYNPYPTVTLPTPGFDIKAEQAWDVNQGGGTVIAIIDDGIDYSHPDLAPNIYRDSFGRIVGKNVGDNCLYSNIDGSDNTGCNYKTIPLDNNYGHGTAVAGAAAAKGNNSTGISGACPNCKIMPIGLESLASGPASLNTANIYDGMVYAVNNGANVINLSLGYNTFVQSISSVIDYAYDNDIVVVASSGNCGSVADIGSYGCITQNQLEYPASYPKVISVSGSNPDGHRVDFATVNSLVDITGPAANIWTTWSQYVTSNCGSGAILSGSSYLCFENGTSFSSPITAGVVGLIIGQNPSLTYSQIESKLKTGTTDVYTLNPSLAGMMGAGNVNACGALTGCQVNPTSSSSTISSSSSSQSNTLLGNINVNFCQGSGSSTILNLTPSTNSNQLNLISQSFPNGVYNSFVNSTGHLDISYYPGMSVYSNLGVVPGTYNLIVQESNNLGNVGGQKEYNLIFNVINCSSSSSVSAAASSLINSSSVLSSSSSNVSSLSLVASVSSSISSISPTASSSLIQSSSLVVQSSSQVSSALSSSSVLISSTISSAPLISSSSTMQSSSSQLQSSSQISSNIISSSSNLISSSSIQYSFGSFFPNATLTGVVGSSFPTFTLSGCVLGSGSTQVTISTGASSIGGTITNCMFTPNSGSNILPAFQATSTLNLNGVGMPSIVIPVGFSLPASSSSSLISSSTLSSSLQSSSQVSSSVLSSSQNQTSSSSISPTVTITSVIITGSQYQISFTPNGYSPVPGGIHTHFYYNTEPNTVTDKMYSQSSPYLLNISTKPANATQICAIVSNPNHIVISNTGNCFILPVTAQSSSSVSSSLLISSVISSSSVSVSSSSAYSSIVAASPSSIQSSSIPTITVVTNNTGGSINITTSQNLSSSRISSASSQSLTSIENKNNFSETKLDYKNELGIKNDEIKLQLSGDGECSKPIEAIIKNAKDQSIKDKGSEYPFGVLNFKVKCGTEVKVKLYFSMLENWDNYKLRKLIFDKTNLSYRWEDYKATLGSEYTNGSRIATAEFTIKDGEYGDDTAKDGFIVDPIGLVKKTNIQEEVKKIALDDLPSSVNDIAEFVLARTGGADRLNITINIFSLIFVLGLFEIRRKNKQ